MTGPRIDNRISLGNVISLAGVMELSDEQVDDLCYSGNSQDDQESDMVIA